MKLLAMLGFALGALAAAGWIVAADRLTISGTAEPDAVQPRPRASLSPDMKISIAPASPTVPQPSQPHLAPIEKPPARSMEFIWVKTFPMIRN